MKTQPADPEGSGGASKAAVSRRRFLGGLATAGAGAALGGGIAVWAEQEPGPGSAARESQQRSPTEPFYGRHQAGIVTPVQERLAFAAFDLRTTNRRELEELLRQWTAAAAALTTGHLVPGGNHDPLAPPADTGEAVGLPPSRLTITVGFGPSLFDERFGLASRRPAPLGDLPALPGDRLEAARSGGDLAIQACSEDPQVAFHAVRNLARLGRGTAVLRWSQLGFGRTSSTSASQVTARNLMGFKDGTRNIRAEETEALEAHVWVGSETDQAWMRGGSYLVARRIRMLIESWDRASLGEQQSIIGRFKESGAPLNARNEFDSPDFAAKAAGTPVIADDAHVRLASAEMNGGIRILRRGYSFTDGIDPATGELDAGLFFIAYQKDPRTQFVPLQRRLGGLDALGEYIRHTGSAVFACPPGVSGPGDYWGRAVFT